MVLKVGASRVDVTPSRAVEMAGYPVIRTQANGPQDHSKYKGRDSKSDGLIDPVWARAVVISSEGTNSALVSLDICVIFPELARAVRERVAESIKVDWSLIEICATHTHSGPDISGMSGAIEQDLEDEMVLGIVEAIDNAYKNLEPATITTAVGQLNGVSINRRNESDEVDSRLPVIVARRQDDSVIAVIYSFSCHPILVGAQNTKLYGDFPGAASRKLENWYGDKSVALFLQGACGDINPRAFPYSKMGNITIHAPSGSDEALRIRTISDAERFGEAIAGVVISSVAVSERETNGSQLHTVGKSIVLVNLKNHDDLDSYLLQRDHNPIRVAQWKNSTQIELGIAAMVLGEIVLLFMPGEPFSGTALKLKKDVASPSIKCVWTVGYASDYPGYLVPGHRYSENRYENAATILDATAVDVLVESLTELGIRVCSAVS